MTDSSPGWKVEKGLSQLQFFCPLQLGPSESLDEGDIRAEDTVPETMSGRSENAEKDHGWVSTRNLLFS